jgi:hypothetical protein
MVIKSGLIAKSGVMVNDGFGTTNLVLMPIADGGTHEGIFTRHCSWINLILAKARRLIGGVLLCGTLFAFSTVGSAFAQEIAANKTDGEMPPVVEKNAPPETSTGRSVSDEKAKMEQMLRSDLETNKEIENPATLLWMLQTAQNNIKMGMPLNKGNYYQSNLEFQPMLPNEISKKWTLGFRPVLDLYDSQPYPNLAGVNMTTNPPTPVFNMKRMTSFGDMTLGIGMNPDPALIHNWLIVVGGSFIFPTATHKVLGQNNWQFGPLLNIGHKGHHYLAYVMQQTWWKIGGDGQRTRQTWSRYLYIYNWANGWSIGTQSDMFVNWQAYRDQRVTFPVGLQVGKLLHAGPLPVKVDVQAQYYPVSPSNLHFAPAQQTVSPKWNFQLQITPIIPTLQEIIHHQIPEDPTRKHKSGA